MCGITGVANTRREQPVRPELLKAMADTIQHRGPDAEGFYLEDSVGLASRRLSIIDLSSGDQPIFNEDRSVAIVYNGEMYNYPALRDELKARGHQFYTTSDTETIVHGYEEWGTDVVSHLNGMFAFALWDRNKQQLMIARDRAGIKPMYYAETPDGLVFGSELKTILQHPGIERKINWLALNMYLSFEYVPSPLSIFEGIHKLPPGAFLVWREGKTHVETYWEFQLADSENCPRRSEGEYLDELLALLRDAVEREMIADVPVGVLLSGGVDSSTVAALMAQVSPGNIKSFSIAMEDASFDESSYAELVARHVGTEHHVQKITAQDLLDLVPAVYSTLDEPLADSSIIPTTLLSQFARKSVKVVLGGDGGDELFAGYSTLQAHRIMQSVEAVIPGPVGRAVFPGLAGLLPASFNNISFDFKLKRFVGGFDKAVTVRHQDWLGSFSDAERQSLMLPEHNASTEAVYGIVDGYLKDYGAHELINRVLYQDMKMYLEGDILVKSDRASMSASLELRVPLLNQVLLEFAARLPHEYKLHGLTTKYLLRRAAEKLVPSQIAGRGKKGFNIPVAKWLTGPLNEMTQDMLSPDRLRREGIFDPGVVQSLLADHMAHRRDARKHLWTLLTFEMWYENWMREPVAAAVA